MIVPSHEKLLEKIFIHENESPDQSPEFSQDRLHAHGRRAVHPAVAHLGSGHAAEREADDGVHRAGDARARVAGEFPAAADAGGGGVRRGYDPAQSRKETVDKYYSNSDCAGYNDFRE